MTLLKLFNKALKELPFISEYLKNSIMEQGWSKEKTQQAVEIIEQLSKKHLLETGNCLGHNYVRLSRLTIILCPSECGINSTTFEPENIYQADRYIKDLLADINRISEDVRFSLGGRNYESGECEFVISWEF